MNKRQRGERATQSPTLTHLRLQHHRDWWGLRTDYVTWHRSSLMSNSSSFDFNMQLTCYI
jgi:hypothetical protein